MNEFSIVNDDSVQFSQCQFNSLRDKDDTMKTKTKKILKFLLMILSKWNEYCLFILFSPFSYFYIVFSFRFASVYMDHKQDSIMSIQ